MRKLGTALIALGAVLVAATVAAAFLDLERPWTAALPLAGCAGIVVGTLLRAVDAVGGRYGAGVRNGPLVIGVLESLEQTGTFVNEQPQVEFTVAFTTVDGRRVTGSDRRLVPLTELPLFSTGIEVPIRYDPARPGSIMLADRASPGEVRDAKDKHDIATGRLTQETVDLKNNGIDARGVVLASRPTGEIDHGSARIEMQLRVTRPNGSTFDVTTTKAVPQHALAFTVPGSVVHVFYLPHDEQHVAVGAET